MFLRSIELQGMVKRLLPGLLGPQLGLAICAAGFIYSLMAFFPGWMSVDSVIQYHQAKYDSYTDWQPVLLAWWWNKLDGIYSGPGLFLVQDCLLYWGAFYLFASGAAVRFGRQAWLLPLAGFWPGLLIPLAFIWKDIVFGISIFFTWSLVFHAYWKGRRLYAAEWLVGLLLCILAVGVKPNGLIVVPFLLFVVLDREFPSFFANRSRQLVSLFLIIPVLSFALAAISMNVVEHKKIIHESNLQYIATHDIAGILALTGQNFMPSYITENASDKKIEIKSMYYSGGNNLLFFNSAMGNLTTRNPDDLSELYRNWRQAVIAQPIPYLRHRLAVFNEFIRMGSLTPGWIGDPGIVKNEFGLTFTENSFSEQLMRWPQRLPVIFLPWAYILALSIAGAALSFSPVDRKLVSMFCLSALAFIAPHFFIAPAADYTPTPS